MSAGAQRSQKRALGFLEQELQAVVSYLTWVLDPELGSSTRTANTLNH
jgi:cytochrome c1